MAKHAPKSILPDYFLADYFLDTMPDDVELLQIFRVENRQPWRQYRVGIVAGSGFHLGNTVDAFHSAAQNCDCNAQSDTGYGAVEASAPAL